MNIYKIALNEEKLKNEYSMPIIETKRSSTKIEQTWKYCQNTEHGFPGFTLYNYHSTTIRENRKY